MEYLSTKPYRGTRDFLPDEMSVREQIFRCMFDTVEAFGFQRYHGPTLEPTAIYEAKSGEEIANQQLYRLVDKGGRELAVRPEMTPSVARIIAGNAKTLRFPVRWYSHASCHRYERPQRGRVREHWQLNVDIFGSDSVEAEVEVFEAVAALMKNLGATEDMYVLRINDRVLVEAALKGYIGVPADKLVDVSMVIDRWEKVSADKRVETLGEIGLSDAQIGRLDEFVTMDLDAYCEVAGREATERSKLAQVMREGLTSAPLKFDPYIIRAFNYYTSTVFEVFDITPGNNRSVFGGGRYDGLTSLFSEQQIPAVGFAVGDVTTWNFLESHDLLPQPDITPQAFLFSTKSEHRKTLRTACAALRALKVRTIPAFENLTLSAGLQQASKRGAKFAVAFSEDEYAKGCALVKDLERSEQVVLPFGEIGSHVAQHV